MIEQKILKRVEKYNFKKHAGEYYVDGLSSIVKDINRFKKVAYFGIQNKAGDYTILGKSNLYFYNQAVNEESKISLEDFLFFSKSIVEDRGKYFDYEYLKIENNLIWVYNLQVFTTFLSLALYLTRHDGYGIKPKVPN